MKIPSPPQFPGLKHTPYFLGDRPIKRIVKFAKRFPEGIYEVQAGLYRQIIAWDSELVAELLDEKKYKKVVHAAVREVKAFAGDGLFTADGDSEAWSVAHRVLAPGFTSRAMKDYFDSMNLVTQSLLDSWAKKAEQGAPHGGSGGWSGPIDVSEDMTRLTMDTISLCGFDFRFNSFDKKELHPFLTAMAVGLREAARISNRPAWLTRLLGSRQRLDRATQTMNQLVDEVIQNRKNQQASQKIDFLSLMMHGKNPKTGQGISDVNMREQIITFLIAGHETTSGLLSFAFYLMFKHPEVLSQARDEVNHVMGQVSAGENQTPTFAQLSQLKWIQQIIQETLRLYSTAPLFAVAPLEDQMLGGKYELPKGTAVWILLWELHRDPKTWGSDANEFRPERFAPELDAKRPTHIYRPFGNGQRACIGRNFAMAEATLAIAQILRHFDLDWAEPYELKIKETLTLKPEGFRIRVRKR